MCLPIVCCNLIVGVKQPYIAMLKQMSYTILKLCTQPQLRTKFLTPRHGANKQRRMFVVASEEKKVVQYILENSENSSVH